MLKSELIDKLTYRYQRLNPDAELDTEDIAEIVNLIIRLMSETLASGGRIEIRGFGSFSLHEQPARMGRNPKTGEAVALPTRYTTHFKPGKELRENVNGSKGRVNIQKV